VGWNEKGVQVGGCDRHLALRRACASSSSLTAAALAQAASMCDSASDKEERRMADST
jgi:hypothetical protein